MFTGGVLTLTHKPQINFATVELVLMLRIWVLYGRSKRVGTFMAISFMVTIGAGLALRNVQPKVVAGDVFTREPFPFYGTSMLMISQRRLLLRFADDPPLPNISGATSLVLY